MRTIEHLRRVVLPSIREYWRAEAALTEAATCYEAEVLLAAQYEAMRRARTAATELHHLADFAAQAGEPPLGRLSVWEVRAAVQARCVNLRQDIPSTDVGLLRDVADAFKHFKLDRTNTRVAGADAVVTCRSGYGKLAFGEGKFGGGYQVVVADLGGNERALTSILQNVVDAWRTTLGLPLPPMNDFR